MNKIGAQNILLNIYGSQENKNTSTVCPRSSDPFYVVTNYIKWVTTFSGPSTKKGWGKG